MQPGPTRRARLAALASGPWALAAAVAIGAIVRVAHVLALRASPTFGALLVDGAYYDRWAQRIAAGDLFGSERIFYMDPLYGYVLGAIYRLAGRDLLAVRLVQAAVSSGTCLLVGLLGRRLAGAAAGNLAALAAALFAPEIFACGEIEKTVLATSLATAALLLALPGPPLARLGAGLSLGLAVLARANLLVFAPLGMAALAWGGARRLRAGAPPAAALLPALAFAAGLAVALGPVVARNRAASGEWALTSARAGENFYIGNNPENPTGGYHPVRNVRPDPRLEQADWKAEAERRAGRALTDREVSDVFFREALAYVAAQPGRAALVLWRKLLLFWNDFEPVDMVDPWVLARWSWVLRLPLLSFGWLVPAAWLAAAVVRRREVATVAGAVALYCATLVAFFVSARYRLPATPALAALSAAGVRAAGDLARRRDGRSMALGGLAALAGAALAFWPVDPADVRWVRASALANVAGAAISQGRTAEAMELLAEAERVAAGMPPVLALVAADYAAAGLPARAEAVLRPLLARLPYEPELWAQLAGALDAQGRAAEARDARERAAAARAVRGRAR